MRIAHFSIGRCNPDSANGVDRAVYSLSKAQAAFDNPVAVFQLTAKDPVPIPGVEVKGYPPSGFPFRLPRELLADLALWKPDIVHLHSIFVPANAALASWLHHRKVPYVVTPHSSLSPQVLGRRRLRKLAYKWVCELPTLNRAAFLHAVADRHGLREYGVRAPVVIAPNGIDLASIPARPHAALLASRYPQVRGKRVFLFVGRLDTVYKGLDLLLEGFTLASLAGAVLVLLGPDYRGHRKSLAAQACRLGIEAQVIFAGPEYGTAKFDLLAGADVFVLCSRSEGLPLAVLEAAASGKPCLVSVAANPGGLIERYEAGIVVQPSAEGIAVGLARLARASESELRGMGLNARRMAEREFSWDSTARMLATAYETYAPRADR